MPLRLRFGAPRANWIPLGLVSEHIAFGELFSAHPVDPLAGIARSALAAARGEPGTCALFGEPEAYTLRFTPVPKGLRLEVVRFPDHARVVTQGALVFQKSGAPDEVLLPVWRGLRELGGRWPSSPEFWRAPFPGDVVAELGGRLGVS